MTHVSRCSLLFAFALVACSSSNPVRPNDASTDVQPDATSQVAPTAMCMGQSFGALTRAELEAAATTGACVDANDLDAVCVNDVQAVTAGCAIECYGSTLSDPASFGPCTSACIRERSLIAPTEACTDCYVASSACVAEYCLAVCVNDGESMGCIACRTAAGCTASFFACSGLPAPIDPGNGKGDGGTDGSVDDGGTDGSVDDGGTDGGVDDGGTDGSVL